MQSSKEQHGEINNNAKKQENNRMEKTRDLFKKIRKYQGNFSGKDGHNKGQKQYGPNRSRRY